MIVKHKAKKAGTQEEIKGYLTKMWGQYHITTEEDENTAYPVEECTIEVCFEDADEKIINANEGYDVLDNLFAEIQKNNYHATQEMLDKAWDAWCKIPVAR